MSADDGAPGISRKPPGPIGRWFARAPRYVYKARLGWLLGNRFVLIEHTGRRTGLMRETVVEVIRRDAESLDVAAAWGTNSDWFRNIFADPSVRVSSGRRRRVPASGAVLEQAEAARVFTQYRTQHPRAARALQKALGLSFDDPTALAAAIPIVRLTYRGEAP